MNRLFLSRTIHAATALGQRWLPLVVFLVPWPGAAVAAQANDQIMLAQADPATGNRGVVQLLNQVEALNADLSRLRGQIEVLTNEISNAQKRQRDMYVDLDTRLRRIEQPGAAAGKKEQETISSLEDRVRRLEHAAAAVAAIPAPVASAAVQPVVAASTAIPSAAVAATAAQPSPPAAAASSASLPPASLSGTDQAAIQRAYDNAYSNYRIGDYQGAIRGFEAFIKSNPKHPLAANAQYWIGESFFHLRDYRAAIETENRLLGAYAESSKAADAMLIIGTAENSLGDNAAARKTFEDLIARYPTSDAAEKAKSRLARLK